MSKRKSTQNRTEILLGAAFFVSAGIIYFNADAGGSLMVIYGALCGAVGYAGGKYQDGETARPSGTLPPEVEDSPLDGLPTPVAR